MSANILEAVQGFATPAMITAATSTLGLNDKQASTALGAAVTSILGGALQKSSNTAVMGNLASLAGAITPDASMFSNIAGMLAGGVPTSPLQVLGNRMLGQIFGVNQATMVGTLATTTGISAKAASGLLTLAAPMALAAIRAHLGASPSPSAVASLLNTDRALIAQAMPAQLRNVFGLVAPASPPAGAAAAKPVAAAPVAHTPSGHASAPMVAPAVQAAPAQAAAAPKPAPAPAAAPMASPAEEGTNLGIGAFIAIMVPLGVMAAAVWYWAFGR